MSSVAVPVSSSSLPRPSAAELRRRVEAELADRIPGALSPHERVAPEMASSGIAALDELTGGWPRGTLSELFGTASSGRTSVLIAALAAATARDEACALIDAGDSFDPESAAAAGVDLKKLLWVRCGKQNPPQRHRGTEKLPNCGTAELPNCSVMNVGGEPLNVSEGHGFSRAEKTAKRTPALAAEVRGSNPGSTIRRSPDTQFGNSAVRQFGSDFGVPEPRDIGIWGYGDTETMERINPALARKNHSPRRREDTKKMPNAVPIPRFPDSPIPRSAFVPSCLRGEKKYRAAYARIEQALKAADLLLGAGGFGLVVIDLAGLPPEAARRVPLTTWFRFRRAVEATSTALLVVSPQAITQSCAALALKLQPSAKTHHRDTETQRIFGASFPDCHHEGAAAPEGSAFLSHAALLTGLRLRAEVIRSPLPGRKRPHSAHAEIKTRAQWA